MIKSNNKLLTRIFTIIVIVSVIVILITTLYTFTKQINNNNIKSTIPDLKKAEILIRQSARYAHAARQDEDILIALLHANYGTGYLWAAKDIFPETMIVKLFNSYKEFKEFERGIVKIQDDVNTRAVSGCPTMVSKRDIITMMGGEGGL